MHAVYEFCILSFVRIARFRFHSQIYKYALHALYVFTKYNIRKLRYYENILRSFPRTNRMPSVRRMIAGAAARITRFRIPKIIKYTS